MSSGEAFAYSTKIRSTGPRRRCPVSISSNSRPRPPRRRFSSIKPLVRISRLRILVQVLHVGVGRGAVEVEVILLDVLAVVALAGREPEGSLLQDRILPVPERQAEDKHLVSVADCRRSRPRPNDRPCCGPYRDGSSPMPPRPRCSLRERCPRIARSRTAPSAARAVSPWSPGVASLPRWHPLSPSCSLFGRPSTNPRHANQDGACRDGGAGEPVISARGTAPLPLSSTAPRVEIESPSSRAL